MRIQMKLISDAIFGSGQSIPGGEDIAILCDDKGFPYYKGSTFKGIFREELIRLLEWKGYDHAEIKKITDQILGTEGDEDNLKQKTVFSDFEISDAMKAIILKEAGISSEKIKDSLTNIRTFTAIDENGIAKEKSLRMARCVDKDLVFFGRIECNAEHEQLIKETLPLIKWIGTMRNRGFGKIKITVIED